MEFQFEIKNIPITNNDYTEIKIDKKTDKKKDLTNWFNHVAEIRKNNTELKYTDVLSLTKLSYRKQHTVIIQCKNIVLEF